MTDTKLRIAYMGTPDFSVPALQALIDGPHDVVAVYAQPPRPKGRGHKLQPSPVHALAEQHDIQIYNPLSFNKEPDSVATFAKLNLDVAIVAAYGLILPVEVLEAPQFGCLNIHASILPRWRGASPIQQAIWAGDSETGVSIMQMDKGLDTGAVITEEKVMIRSDTTASSLHDELSILGSTMVTKLMEELARTGDKLNATPQDDATTTYAPLLKKEDGRIDWTQDAAQIDCQIRALNPWPGTWTMINDQKRLKITAAKPSKDQTKKQPGTILNREGDIACGKGTVLTLQNVQPENAKRMDFVSAINGGHLTENDQL